MESQRLSLSVPRLAAQNLPLVVVLVAALVAVPGWVAARDVPREPGPRPRIRDLGVRPGVLAPGPVNAITDVDGVRVGHRTLIRGEGTHAVRTGVTAVLPHAGDLFLEKVPAAVFVGNGFGKAAGLLQVRELGEVETPIVLTNTLSVGTAVEAVVAWTLASPGHEDVRSVNAVVGETNDGWLNDIRGLHVTREDVVAAIEEARSAAAGASVEEGTVGAGTGTSAFGWKGGIGTASRRLPEDLGGWTVGVLVQSNFGGVLTVDGLRMGEALGRYSFREILEGEEASSNSDGPDDGSCMVVVATDAPLSPRNLERLARRAVLGLARTGSFMSNGSGDFVVAFSTAYRIPHGSDELPAVELLPNHLTSPLFLGVVESVEEAVYNSLTRATTVQGREGHTREAIPLERLRKLLQERASPRRMRPTTQ